MGSPSVEARWRTMRVLWFALCTSHLLFGFVVWFTRFGPSAPKKPLTPEPALFYGLAVEACVVAVVSVILPAYFFRQSPKVRALNGVQRLTDEQLRAILPVAQTPFILGMALCESVTLSGFVLGFLGFPPERFAPLFALGFLLALSRFPGEDWLKRMLPGSGVL